MYRLSLACLLAITAALLSASAHAKSTDSDGKPSGQELWDLTETKLFNGQTHRVYIKMNQAVWNQLHDDEKNNGCVKGDQVKWGHVRYFVLDDQILKDVALRVRGNTSRCIPRLQFSIAFDKANKVYTRQGNEAWREVRFDPSAVAAIKDRKVHGLSELSLRRSFNDSSAENDSGNGLLAREFVAAWAVARTEGVAKTTLRGAPVYRGAYANVEFQLCADDKDRNCANRFRRVYLIAEPIDKGFFRMRYDDANPTFFSMSHGCALKGARGFTPACLEPEYIKGKKYDEQDASQQAALAALLTGPDGLKSRIDAAADGAALGKVLDLDALMNYAAGATTVGHWDSAYGNFNNDVLYWHEPSGRWKLITWDLDNTFDYDARGGPGHTYSYADVVSEPRLLFGKLFSLPELDARFRERLKAYLGLLYRSPASGPLHDKIQEVRDQTIGNLNGQMVRGERQNLQRAQEMFDYAGERKEVLNRQIQGP